MTGLGELRGAVGTQFGHKLTTALSFEGDCLLDPARTSSLATFWFEELQLTKRLRLQAAARIEQTKVDGIGLVTALSTVATILRAHVYAASVPASASSTSCRAAWLHG